MAHDNSMASKVEEWIVNQLKALAELPDDQVAVFEGSLDVEGGGKVLVDMLAKRTPYAVVLFEGDRAIPLEEGQNAYEPVYAIYCGVQNRRGSGTGRVGDGTSLGVNGFRDLIRTALHDKGPALSAGGYYTDRTDFRGVKIVYENRNGFILRAEMVVQESPTA